MSEVTGLVGAVATLVAGITGLIKAIRLWRRAQENWQRAQREAMESEQVSQLTMRNRLLELTNDHLAHGWRGCEERLERWSGGPIG